MRHTAIACSVLRVASWSRSMLALPHAETACAASTSVGAAHELIDAANIPMQVPRACMFSSSREWVSHCPFAAWRFDGDREAISRSHAGEPVVAHVFPIASGRLVEEPNRHEPLHHFVAELDRR